MAPCVILIKGYYMLLTFFILVAGFVLLIKGADFFVSGSSSLGVKLHIPQMVIGLTIVALGTSLPEFFINIIGSISHKNDIVLGNILGSNIFNVLLILGISAVIFPVMVKKNTVWHEIPFVFLVSFVLFVLSNDTIFGSTESEISRGDGIILLIFLGFFLLYLFRLSRQEDSHEEIKCEMKMWKIILFILTGITGLIAGGNLVVDSAVKIAVYLGISEKLIAVTIIAMGTGLPELVTSVVASCKKNSSLALGNIVGSNIFNILLVISFSAVISPVKISSGVYLADFSVLLLSSVVLFVSMFIFKKSVITRFEGVIYLLLYSCFIFYNVSSV